LVSPEETAQARREFGIGAGPIGLSLASLHADKRLDFLFEAARRIREQIPDFQLVIVGDGPQRELVKAAVDEAGGWIHWLGARAGRDKARVLSMSRLMLNPGMVGLSILDSLVAGVPMVTTNYPYHSPEIVYLHSGVNGLMTENDLESFSVGVVRLLKNLVELEALRVGCQATAQEYTIEKMADHFCNGILACLSSPEKGKECAPLGQKTIPAERA